MGFDNECIPNIQSLAGEYFCPVCRLLVYPNEALQSMCTHLYCKPCLTYVAGTSKACPYDGYLVTEADAKPLMESNKALADTIGKIMVCCLYQKSGCTWQGTLSESTSHCSGCAFGNSPVVCNRCGIQIVHRQVQEHAHICVGMQQPQIWQSLGSQPIVPAGTVASRNQNQLSIQAGAAVVTSQANASQTISAPALDPNQKAGVNPQGQAVAAAVSTPEQWYLQQYQYHYQNYLGYHPYQQQTVMANLQQQLQSQSQAPQVASVGQHQATNVRPLSQSEPIQAQMQLQAQPRAVALVTQSQPVLEAAPASQPQNQTVAGSLPWPYPSILSNSPVPSQAFPPSEDLHHLKTQSHFHPQPIPQAYTSQPHSQHALAPSQVLQYSQTQSHFHPQPIPQAYPSQAHSQHAKATQCQQIPGQVQSQLHIQPPPSHSQTNTVQNIQPLHASQGISSGGNQQPVNPGLLDFQRRAAVPSGQIPAGVSPHMPTHRYPPPVLRPHGPKLLPGTPPGPATAPSLDGGPRPHGLGHHVADGIDDRGHLLPSHAPKAYPSDINSLASFDRGFGMGIFPRPVKKYGVDYNSGPTSRFFQSSNDLVEVPLGNREDGREMLEAACIHPGFHGPVPGFGRRHIDGPRSPLSEFLGMPSHTCRPLENGLGSVRMGEPLVGSDGGRGDHFGSHGLFGHLKFEEPIGSDGFPQRRPGDPGFRSRYSLQGFPNNGRSFLGDMKPFEISGKRKLATMNWCRICKVDCETVEGLDLHSQTKEHQKMSMDMVVMIKQNAKKYKLMKEANSEDHDSKKKAIP